MVDALKHIVGLVLFGSFHLIGVVDETFTQGLNLANRSFVGKLANDSCQLFLLHNIR